MWFSSPSKCWQNITFVVLLERNVAMYFHLKYSLSHNNTGATAVCGASQWYIFMVNKFQTFSSVWNLFFIIHKLILNGINIISNSLKPTNWNQVLKLQFQCDQQLSWVIQNTKTRTLINIKRASKFGKYLHYLISLASVRLQIEKQSFFQIASQLWPVFAGIPWDPTKAFICLREVINGQQWDYQ